MKVKVVSLENCAATPQTIERVKEVAAEMGVSVSLEHVMVKTPEDAALHRLIGSPTVQVNGMDIDAGARTVREFGLT